MTEIMTPAERLKELGAERQEHLDIQNHTGASIIAVKIEGFKECLALVAADVPAEGLLEMAAHAANSWKALYESQTSTALELEQKSNKELERMLFYAIEAVNKKAGILLLDNVTTDWWRKKKGALTESGII